MLMFAFSYIVSINKDQIGNNIEHKRYQSHSNRHRLFATSLVYSHSEKEAKVRSSTSFISGVIVFGGKISGVASETISGL
jgi:hypothetical protein